MSVEPIRPNQEFKDEIREILEESGPLTFEEISTRVSEDEDLIQPALTELWREKIIVHTLDRKFDLRRDDLD